MKKFGLLFISISLLFSVFSAEACAQDVQAQALPYVTDAAGIMDSQETASLESFASEVSEKYGCGVYIAAIQDYRDYSASSVSSAAETIFTSSGMGLGADKNGILLMLSMDDRDYYMVAHGDIANAAFTDYGKDMLEDCFLDDFRNDDWYSGFYDYISECGQYLDSAAQGNPVDTIVYDEPEEMGFVTKLLIAVVPSCIIALLVCFAFKAQMKTAKKQTQARAYIGQSGVNMRVVQDNFTHRTQTVQVIPKNDSKGGGHPGGTTVNSGGFSGRGGKF